MAEAALLRVEHLSKSFAVKSRGRTVQVQAVRDVSFAVAAGRTLALVGESGCGKTTTGRLILRLIEPDSGALLFDGEDLTRLPAREMKKLRRSIQIVFQDPLGSLNPRMTVGAAILEPLHLYGIRGAEAAARLGQLLADVELDPQYARCYPHELSGGQRQRVAIARALALGPRLIVADEPVSALDASIQSQILNLLAKLQSEHGLAFVFISHDLAVVRHIADEVAVMYLGEIVEHGPTVEVFSCPQHPYTRALLAAIPEPRAGAPRVTALEGALPSAVDLPVGCAFASRCPFSMDRCVQEAPAAFAVGPGHTSRCWLNRSDSDTFGA